MSILKNLIMSPYFWIGVGFRIFCLISFESIAINEWYSPFLRETSQNIGIDPWTVWIEAGGSLEAFPYGYIMWLIFLMLGLRFRWHIF